MDLKTYKLPPVSLRFFETLLKVFPPLDHKDIKEHTSIIEIQRKVGQQEVLDYIYKSVNLENETKIPKLTLLERIRVLFTGDYK